MPPLPLLSLGIPGFSSLRGDDSQVQYQSLEETGEALASRTQLLPIFVVGKLLFTVLSFTPIVHPRHVLHPVTSIDGEPSGCKDLPPLPIFP